MSKAVFTAPLERSTCPYRIGDSKILMKIHMGRKGHSHRHNSAKTKKSEVVSVVKYDKGVEISLVLFTVKILKFGTPQTIAIIVLKIEKFDVTLH